MAKVFLCCGFIPCDDKDRNYDFVAGGSNGVVRLLVAITDHMHLPMYVCMHVWFVRCTCSRRQCARHSPRLCAARYSVWRWPSAEPQVCVEGPIVFMYVCNALYNV